jgi:hypothetical protein
MTRIVFQTKRGMMFLRTLICFGLFLHAVSAADTKPAKKAAPAKPAQSAHAPARTSDPAPSKSTGVVDHPAAVVRSREAPRPAPSSAAPLTVPEDAEKIGDNTYRKTENGRVWVYRRTPFGVTRMEEGANAVPAATAAKQESFITAVEEGDVVRFERKAPFGSQKWTRKKAELNDEERTVLEQSRGTSKSAKQ